MAPAAAAEQDPGSKYEVRHQIGRGSFGSAFLVTNKQDKADYVLKRVRLAKQTKWQRDSTLQERDLATSLRHPFIVPCVESWVVQNHTVNMIYAFCQNGDLSSYLAKTKKQGALIDEALMQKWLCQLLLALDYMQTQHVLHRDIKTSNLMLTCDNDVQLGDFGLATLMEEDGDESRPQDTNLVGTPHYMSPELLSCKAYGFKTDVWSLGCVFYELTAQRPTFQAFNIHGLVSKIRKSKLTPLPATYSADWRDIVALMLCKNPERRPSVQQLMALPALRPAMLDARARAQQLMPAVPLPPLLNPTPLTPQPIAAPYCASEAQDVAAESAGSVGSMCDQHGTGRSGASSVAGSSRNSWGPDDRRSGAMGLAAVTPMQANELSELWKANFGQLQQQEQQDTAAKPGQQPAPGMQLEALHDQRVQQQRRQLSVQEEQLAHQGPCSAQCSKAGSSSSSGGCNAGSASCCTPEGSHTSSTGAACVTGTRGLCAGYSPRGASHVIDGYKRLVTPRQQHVHQPGIKRTPAERVAAAIAAAGQQVPATATGRLTPELCPRPLAGLSPAASSATRSDSSSSWSTPGGVTQKQQPGSAQDSIAAAEPTLPGCDVKQRSPAGAADCTLRPATGQQADAALPPKPALGKSGAAVARRPSQRPLSAPRSTSARRASDRGSNSSTGGSKQQQQQQQQQRPAWGCGGGCRPLLTPGRHRPESSPLIKALKATNAAAAAAGAGPVMPEAAGAAVDSAMAATVPSSQRRSHGQLSPMPSHQPVTEQGAVCSATSSRRSSHPVAPAGDQGLLQQHLAEWPKPAERGQEAACSAGSHCMPTDLSPSGPVAWEQSSVSPVHGLPRRTSHPCTAHIAQQDQRAEIGPASRGASIVHCSSASNTAGLPPLPLHRLQHADSMCSMQPPQLSPLPLASPVCADDRASADKSIRGTKQQALRSAISLPHDATAGMPVAGGSSSDLSATPCTQQAVCSNAQNLGRTPRARTGPVAAHSSICSRASSSQMQEGVDAGPHAAPGGTLGARRSSRHASSTAASQHGSSGGHTGTDSCSTSGRSSSGPVRQPQHAGIRGPPGNPAIYSTDSSKRANRNESRTAAKCGKQQQQQLPPAQAGQMQASERLELLESAMMVISGLVERKRWTELSTLMRSAGLLPGSLSADTDAGTVTKSASKQQPRASDVLKLGDIVVLGSSRSIKGQIRYIGPVAWDPSAADWVGMELDTPCGVDATQRGLTYFECAPRCASFHKAADLTSLTA